ncbi:MAG: peptide deformylase [Candidatus Limnocylindrales bacterium]
MSLRPIVTLGDARLRRPGDRVRRFDKDLHRLLDEMVETMRAAPGVGIAAHQVGVPLQVCVIEAEGHLHELVNPRLISTSGQQDDLEGCLSIPGFYAYRTRAAQAVMEAQDRRGRRIRLVGTGLLARAMQHEFDPLQGELYIALLGPDAKLNPTAELQAADEAEADVGSARDGALAAVE